MFKEWLERMAIGFLFTLVMIVILLTLALFGTLWYLIYEASKLLGISILIVVLGVPLITFIYTVYDNWSDICYSFEEKKRKWENRNV